MGFHIGCASQCFWRIGEAEGSLRGFSSIIIGPTSCCSGIYHHFTWFLISYNPIFYILLTRIYTPLTYYLDYTLVCRNAVSSKFGNCNRGGTDCKREWCSSCHHCNFRWHALYRCLFSSFSRLWIELVFHILHSLASTSDLRYDGVFALNHLWISFSSCSVNRVWFEMAFGMKSQNSQEY